MTAGAVRDVGVRVRLGRRDPRIVSVLMVLVVSMKVVMLERLVHVLVLMVLRDMEPHPRQHERAARAELDGERLAERGHGGQRAHERRDGEVGAGPCRAQVTEGPHKQRSRAASEAATAARPNISRTGPTSPPATTAAVSQGPSARRSGASREACPIPARTSWNPPRPMPDPRYRSPASIQGAVAVSRTLAAGVLRPNSRPATRANPTARIPCLAPISSAHPTTGHGHGTSRLKPSASATPHDSPTRSAQPRRKAGKSRCPPN